ncbi:TIGR02186 family protein [Tropicimonas sp.]|uniref:TIGR02186 family protein n=1 Tax=Tropicimonas sp. TaxID=2067044 RepID=UPI003A8863FC
MRRLLCAVLFCLALAGPALAQQLVADLSQSRVSITTSFSGTQILVFGAIREGTAGTAEPFDIIVTVSGPLQPAMVRRKDRVAGIWVNADAVEIDFAPTFYNVSTSAPLNDILSETSDIRHSISIARAIRSVGIPDGIMDSPSFTEALIRIRSADGSYKVEQGDVTVIGRTLFRTGITLPANLVEGNYTARIFMVRDKRVIATFTDVLDVQKIGIERWIYNLAQDRAPVYGLLSLAIAIFAGWGASAAFRYVRGN